MYLLRTLILNNETEIFTLYVNELLDFTVTWFKNSFGFYCHIFVLNAKEHKKKGKRQTDGQTDMLRAEPHAEMPSMFFELQHV